MSNKENVQIPAFAPSVTLLQISNQNRYNWIGVDIPPAFADRVRAGIHIKDPSNILKTPVPHVTLLYGFDPSKFEQVKARVLEAKLCAEDIVLEEKVYKIAPTHTETNFYCVDLDVVKSPKVVELIQRLRKEFPTPGNKADHEVTAHLTLYEVKRPPGSKVDVGGHVEKK